MTSLTKKKTKNKLKNPGPLTANLRKMAEGGSTKVFRQLFSSVRYDNGSASNAISAQIFKTLPAMFHDRLK